MIKNYLKTAIRGLLRNKGFSIINIVGLAAGLAVCILILLWVTDEYNFDRFNEKRDNIHRVIFSYIANGRNIQHWRTPPPLAATLKEKYPEIKDAVRFHNEGKVLVSSGDKKLKMQAGYTDQSIFSIFTLPFLYGNSENALQDPSSCVITNDMSRKLFADADPVGKVISIDNFLDLTVTGVLQERPAGSHLEFDLLMQWSHMPSILGYGGEDDWGDFGFNTFLLLQENADIAAVGKNINQCVNEIIPELGREFFLQPLNKIHLYNLDGSPGAMKYIIIFTSIALFILLIACINFMNLSTARSTRRAREIGLRKVVGAVKNQIRAQFLLESLILAFIAMLLAVGIVELLLPYFNSLTDKSLSFRIYDNNLFWALVGLTMLTGLLSGSYPALLLSSLKPVVVLKGQKTTSSQLLRKILVIFQFTLSIVLIISTIFVARQLSFLQKQDLGFNKDNVIYLPLNKTYVEKYDFFKQELLKNPEVKSVTWTSNNIGISPKWTMGINEWEGNDGSQEINLPLISCGTDFLETFGLELVAGEFFSSEGYDETKETAWILNETAVKMIGLENPVGKSFYDGYIKGIVKDFNYGSLHRGIGPLALLAIPEWHNFIAVKVNSSDLPGVISAIGSISKDIAPEFPFEYHFLDGEFEKLYRQERKMGELFSSFALIAIVISCLGLFGLASFVTEQRTREIGIRKVLGSTTSGIVGLFSYDFGKLVIIANIISWPVAYLVMSKWLQSFAYRTDLSIWIFAASGLISILIALMSISSQTIRVALTDPAKTLKYE